MKVKCQLCGTKFDLEKNNSVCPECACHYHVDGESERSFSSSYEHDEIQDAYDNSIRGMHDDDDNEFGEEQDDILHNIKSAETGSFSPHYTVNEDNTSFTKVKQVRSRSGIRNAIMGMEILAIVFLILLPFVGKYASNMKLENQRVDEEIIEETQSMFSGIDIGNHIITFTGLYEETDYNWELPDGYEVIVMAYHMEEKEFDPDFTRYDTSCLIEAYIITKEGKYIAPLESYNVKELIGDETVDTFEMSISDEFIYEDGIMFFVIKKGDYDSVMFNLYTGDSEYRQLDKTINFYDAEVAR